MFGEVIPFPELPRGPSPLFARLKDKIEPLGQASTGRMRTVMEARSLVAPPAGTTLRRRPRTIRQLTTSLPCYSDRRAGAD